MDAAPSSPTPSAHTLALVVAAGAFLVAMLWRVRPAGTGRRRRSREALKEAQARIEVAADGGARAVALCEAGDLASQGVGGGARAASLYARALREDPTSAVIVQRAAAGLARRPRALEALLWRHLGSAAWSGASRASVAEALGVLVATYEGPRKSAVRARALARAREALEKLT